MKKLFLLTAFILSFEGSFSQGPGYIWAKSFGGTSSETGKAIATDAAGNIYSCGFFLGTVDFDPGPGTFTLNSAGMEDVFVTKWDPSGNFQWARSFGGTSYDY